MIEPASAAALLLAIVAVAGAPRAQGVATPRTDDPLAAFAQKKAPDQERIAAQVRAAVDSIDSPFAASLRACIGDAAVPVAARNQHLPQHKAKKTAAVPLELPLPLTVKYGFGLGSIEPVAGDGVRSAGVQAALVGAMPGSDLALAALLRRLDHDTGADRFALFLESWRNGDESFYQALDRTAGTPQGVFFYDVMLGDFSAKFGVGGGATARRARGLQATHDALHDAFLAYRQYRAFREALAWSLVLPPQLPLPANLERYEQAPEGTYALRDQVQMVLAVEDFDVRKVADLVVASAAALPQPLWSAPYEPLTAWHAIFEARLDAMIEAEADTDAFLAKARQHLIAHAERVRGIAQAALAGPGTAR